MPPYGLQPIRLLCPLRGFPDPGIEPRSLALQADSLPPESPGEPIFETIVFHYIPLILSRVMWTVTNRSWTHVSSFDFVVMRTEN